MNELVKAFEFAPATRMVERDELAREFYSVVLDADEQPLFVADEATVYGVWFGEDEAELLARCYQHYGVMLKREQLHWRLWQVLDYLQEHRQAQT